jgi:hypothetical protein
MNSTLPPGNAVLPPGKARTNRPRLALGRLVVFIVNPDALVEVAETGQVVQLVSGSYVEGLRCPDLL